MVFVGAAGKTILCMSFDSRYVGVQCARSLLGLYPAIEGDLKDAMRWSSKYDVSNVELTGVRQL